MGGASHLFISALAITKQTLPVMSKEGRYILFFDMTEGGLL